MLIGGDPGIGKSTLLLQVAARLARDGPRRRLCLAARKRPSRCGCARARLGLGDGAGAARRGDLGARHPDHAGRAATPPALLVINSIQTMHSDLIEGAPGTVSQVRASAQELIRFAKEQRHRAGARRPRHQGRHDRRPARARAHGRHGAELRGRAQPPVPHPARAQEPLRRHRRDRRVRDGGAGADRSPQPVGAVPDRTRRAGQRHQRLPGDRRHAAGAGRDPGADRAAASGRDAAARGGRLGQRAGWR